MFPLAFGAFFALPTQPVPHVPRTVCRRLGFRSLEGFWFGRCGVASSLLLALGRSKQVVHDSCALCLTQQKEFLAPSTTHAVIQTRFLTTSRFTVLGFESQFASRSCGDSIFLFLQLSIMRSY